MNQTNFMCSSTNIMGILSGNLIVFQALLSQLWPTTDGTQKDYNGVEITTYLHLQINLNIKAYILRICTICGIIYFTVNVLTVSRGKEGNGWHKALICWNTQLSSSKNIFRNCWVFWLLYDLK